MMRRMRIKEYIDSYLENASLFNAIASNTKIDSFPKLKAILNTTDAGFYDIDYISHSGDKYISNYLINIIDINTASARLNYISTNILLKYGENWERVIEAFNSDYNPIENYSMDEHEEVNSSITNSVDTDVSNYGFNSATEPVPTNKGKNVATTSGDVKDNYRDLHRGGNIGVTTSQQMIQSELDLRRYNLLTQIYNDIDKLLTLKIYN